MRARYYRALIQWLPKQDERIPELAGYGYITNRHITVVSSTEHATDLQLLREKPLATPATLIYVRTAEIKAHHAANKAHVELTPATLPSSVEISLPQLRKAARKLGDLITSTIDEESIRTRYEEACAFDGLTLLKRMRVELEHDLDGCSSDAIDDVIEALI